MAVLQLNDQQFPLSADSTRIGAGTEADVALPGDAELGVQAVIERTSPDVLVIRRSRADAQVRVNGVLLGAEPTPLMHGDKVEVAGHELRFADDSKRGATQYVSSDVIAALSGARRVGGALATAASGGRLVSLVDGKEYSVPSAGLVIGRDAGCDIVVGRNEVSRRHAQIAPTEQGYLLRDTSANGVWVNGSRVQGSHRLARSDVIRLGSEEFRFYADVLAAPAAGPLVEHTTGAVGDTVSLGDADAPPRVAGGSDAMPVDDGPPILATLEVINEGPAKGSRYFVRTPLAHVGRGPHNDVRLADESVSETHAKLQRRDDGWYAVDMGSTNGTYVGGSRVTVDRLLQGAPDVRFGGVKLRFLPADLPRDASVADGTRAATDRARLASSLAEPAREAESAVPASRQWFQLMLALALAIAGYFVLKGRS
jgi:pSer/pThr/pTyr-binding forkhead associated (FHA) protein